MWHTTRIDAVLGFKIDATATALSETPFLISLWSHVSLWAEPFPYLNCKPVSTSLVAVLLVHESFCHRFLISFIPYTVCHALFPGHSCWCTSWCSVRRTLLGTRRYKVFSKACSSLLAIRSTKWEKGSMHYSVYYIQLFSQSDSKYSIPAFLLLTDLWTSVWATSKTQKVCRQAPYRGIFPIQSVSIILIGTHHETNRRWSLTDGQGFCSSLAVICAHALTSPGTFAEGFLSLNLSHSHTAAAKTLPIPLSSLQAYATPGPH